MRTNLNVTLPLYSRAKDFAVRSIAGETILVPIRSGVGELDSIFLLNETGSTVWEMVETAESADVIADAVTERFEVSREEAILDVREYLAALEQAGLIQSAGKATS